MTYLASYAAALIVFVIGDMIWLGTMVSRFYRPILEEVLLPTVNLPAAIVFYLLYPLGLVIFAITPALKADSATTAFLYGALFGFFTYATYDLSNFATLRNWTMQLTVVDIAWGTILGAITASVGYVLGQYVSGIG
jgi:uncharacterized membrane protein